ncbi:MAG: RHS repeat-associated core domain-containing protein [Verrucomicrobiales bacterium]
MPSAFAVVLLMAGGGSNAQDAEDLNQKAPPLPYSAGFEDADGFTLGDLIQIEVGLNASANLVSGSKKSVFSCDGLSRRYKAIEYTHNGTTWGTATRTDYWLWAGDQIVQKRVGGVGQTAAKNNYYGMGETRHANSTSAGTDYYYTLDHLGSIRELLDSSGKLTTYDYTPYGIRSKQTGSGSLETDFGFTGHLFHAESGLWLTKYRAYDAKLGRWLSEDPIGEIGGLNLFEYAASSPLMYVDPLGASAMDRIKCARDIAIATASVTAAATNLGFAATATASVPLTMGGTTLIAVPADVLFLAAAAASVWAAIESVDAAFEDCAACCNKPTELDKVEAKVRDLEQQLKELKDRTLRPDMVPITPLP